MERDVYHIVKKNLEIESHPSFPHPVSLKTKINALALSKSYFSPL